MLAMVEGLTSFSEREVVKIPTNPGFVTRISDSAATTSSTLHLFITKLKKAKSLVVAVFDAPSFRQKVPTKKLKRLLYLRKIG